MNAKVVYVIHNRITILETSVSMSNLCMKNIDDEFLNIMYPSQIGFSKYMMTL